MHFIIFGIDKPGVADKRAEVMQAHIEYLNAGPIKNVVSGPLTSDDGADIVGSFYLVEAENRQAVDAFQKDDPLVQADIWETVEVRAFNKRVDNRD